MSKTSRENIKPPLLSARDIVHRGEAMAVMREALKEYSVSIEGMYERRVCIGEI